MASVSRGEEARGKIVAQLEYEGRAASIGWSLEQGKKKRRKRTEEQEKILASEPRLDAAGHEIARAYRLLSTCRVDVSAPIPATAVWEWLDRTGIDSPSLRRHMENVFMGVDALMMKRTNRPPKEPAPDSKRGRPRIPDRRRRIAGPSGK